MSKALACSILTQLLLCTSIAVSGLRSPEPNIGTLSGEVADEVERTPIPSAFVYVHAFGGKEDRVAKLDRDGRFNIELEAGIYSVFVAASGFSPTCKSVSIEAGRDNPYAPRLHADSENLEHAPSHR